MSATRLRWFLATLLATTGCSSKSPTTDLSSGGSSARAAGGASGSAGGATRGVNVSGTGGGTSAGGASVAGGSTGASGGVGQGGSAASGGSGDGGNATTSGGPGGSIGGGTSSTGTGGAHGDGGPGDAAGSAPDGAGGGTSTTTGSNVVPAIVDNGPGNIGSEDVAFISVTVCVPGTATCATIDHVSIDTGSTGLRLIATALPSGFALPQQTTGGNPETECFTFADGYVWGSVRLADLKIGGESAGKMQLQLIGDPGFSTVPSDCQATGSAEDTVADFGGNGILGISQSLQDCGSECTQTGTPGYYSCQGSSCTGVAMPLANQLANPVTLFAGDNNGAVLTFPTVPAAGAATLSGTLTFGVGTQANNALGSAQTFTVDADGNLTTVFNSTTMSESFIDSGTNSLSFNDRSLTQCRGEAAGFYCPTTATAESATITGRNNVSTTVTFSVANADTLLQSQFTAFDNLASTGLDSQSFDWGFPFFIGRAVFIGFALPSSPGGNGYVAF